MREEDIKKSILHNMFKDYPDIVGVNDMRKMLGGIGRTSAYKLLKEKIIYSKKIAREYKIPKICIIEYLLSS